MLRLLYRFSDRLRHQGRLRQGNPAHAWGKRGEDLAQRVLQNAGLTIIARNYRTPNGHAEVDLIALNGETIVFVEVKTRASDEYGSPESAVDSSKRRKIQRGAEDYLRRSGREDSPVRFDVISVLTGPPISIQHIQDAFSRQR